MGSLSQASGSPNAEVALCCRGGWLRAVLVQMKGMGRSSKSCWPTEEVTVPHLDARRHPGQITCLARLPRKSTLVPGTTFLAVLQGVQAKPGSCV